MLPLKSILGNFLFMYLMAGSIALSVRKPGRSFESAHNWEKKGAKATNG